jgi:hypothetical protein
MGTIEDHSLRFGAIHEDLHLVELRIRVGHEEWSALSTACASLSLLTEAGEAIHQWTGAPNELTSKLVQIPAFVGWFRSFTRLTAEGHTP